MIEFMSKEITIDQLPYEVLRIKNNKKSPISLIEKVCRTTLQNAKDQYKAHMADSHYKYEACRTLEESNREYTKLAVTNPNSTPVAEVKFDFNDEKNWMKSLDMKKLYTHNKEQDTYVVYIKTKGGNICVSGDKLRSMLSAYSNSNGNGSSINDICRKFQFPRPYFNDLKTAMGWTHDMLPITDEELLSKTTEELVTDQIQQKRLELHEALVKKEWQETQNDANKWKAFVYDELAPFEQALATWYPKPVPAPLYDSPINMNAVQKNTFLLGLSDLHFGAKANADELFCGEDYNAEAVMKVIDDYAMKIKATVDDRAYTFNKVVICVLGDILHTLSGFTARGTALETDTLREEQFLLALDSLTRFFQRMLEIFGKVEIKMVKGNHAGCSEFILFKALELSFKSDARISFVLSQARSLMFREGNTVILLDHGDFDAGSKVPTAQIPREAYIQNKFLSNAKLCAGAKHKIFLQGHLHHFLQQEYRGFEFIMCSSPVLGDRFTDGLGFNSRPRQNGLVLTDDGIAEVLHYYFD